MFTSLSFSCSFLYDLFPFPATSSSFTYPLHLPGPFCLISSCSCRTHPYFISISSPHPSNLYSFTFLFLQTSTLCLSSISSSCFFPSNVHVAFTFLFLHTSSFYSYLFIPDYSSLICRYQKIVLPPQYPVLFLCFSFFLSWAPCTVSCYTLIHPYFPALLTFCLFPKWSSCSSTGLFNFSNGILCFKHEQLIGCRVA
jgi:hypothetical protein